MLAIVDADSYLKWAAATLDRLAPSIEHRVLIVANPTMPSAAQVAAALVSSRLRPEQVAVLPLDDAVAAVRLEAPDAVLVGMRGPIAAIVLDALAGLPRRPVLVTGIPGIALPVRRKALVYRAQADLHIVHSRVERAAFVALARQLGLPLRVALSTLPFLDRRAARGDDIVFAAQSLVPARRADRRAIVEALIDTARRHPERRVVLKVRALGGEAQTHAERWPLPTLLPPAPHRPANLVVQAGSMARALDTAGGVVSVSSTALIEAVARDIPALVLGDFGVGDEQLNGAFVGSGLIGSLHDLRAARFARAVENWRQDNYLHPAEEDDARAVLAALIRERAEAPLPVHPPGRSRRGGALRQAWYRRTALGRHDTGPWGAVAVAVGVPARASVRAMGALRRLVGSRGV
ncbi:MAG: DUF6716 putative glycosyltransferase [Microcella sp.]